MTQSSTPSRVTCPSDAATDERMDDESSAQQLIDSLDGAQLATAAAPENGTTEVPSTAQPRRSMTRARKPSSRLLPSPSPPPARSSSYYHHHSNKPVTAATTTSTTSNGVPMKNSQKKQYAANANPMNKVTVQPTSPIVATSNAEHSDDKEFGPGKRKRRPSTMTKPPSTITKQAVAPSAHLGSSASAASSAGASLKVRTNRIASKSLSPEEKGAHGPRRVKVEKVKEWTLEPKSHVCADLPSSTGQANEASGYESDGNVEAARLMALAEPDVEGDNDDESDAGWARSQSSFTKGGPSRTKHDHQLTSSREKYGPRRWQTSSGNSALEPPPLISRRGGLKSHQGFTHASQRSSSKLVPGENHHGRSQSTSVLDGKWAWKSSAIPPTLRFRLAGEEESGETSDMDEEDDFHVAMLDGGDFADQHPGKAASLCSKSSHRDSKSGDDSETEDTPATTPRSPQSTCDLPERRWSTGVDEDEKESRKASNDAVFAHALEPSSRRPHTHAGSLTLSLPFDEMVQTNEEEQSVPASIGKDEAEPESVVAEDARTSVKEEDGSIPTGLLSPPIQQGIMGLSSKQHSLMLSSPHSSSAFASPSFEGTGGSVKSEPVPLSLPPPASIGRGRREAVKKRREGTGIKHARLASPINALHSSDDEEEEGDEQTALAMEPPESMCLSELDRAWEQSEYFTVARFVAGAGDGDGCASERDVEETVSAVEGDFETEVGDGEGQEEDRPRRGGKRVGVEEGPAGKRAKTSQRNRSRRSARKSGVRA